MVVGSGWEGRHAVVTALVVALLSLFQFCWWRNWSLWWWWGAAGMWSRFLHPKPMLSPPVLSPVLCLEPETPHSTGSSPLSSPRGLGSPTVQRVSHSLRSHHGWWRGPLFKHALPISSLHHTVSWLLWRDGMRFLASVSPRWLSICHLLGPQLSCRGSLTWLAYPFVRKLETQKLLGATWDCIDDKLLLFSCSVVSDSLQPQGLQHTRLPCPSPSPGACPNACPLSRWCHPTISSSVVPFSSCLQSFPASGSFLMSQLFESHGRSIGASASASALPMNIQDWFPLGLTSLISLQAKGLSRVFSNTTVLKHHFFNAQPSLWSSCHVCTWLCQVGDDNWHIGEPVSCPQGREASSSVAKSGCGSHVPRMPAFPE